MLYRKSEHPKKKCLFGREENRFVRVVPCRVDEPVCCDEASDPDASFCLFYSTVYKKLLLRLPLYNLEITLLMEINTASAQLHPNTWAFVWGFSILCHHFGHLPSVEVFLYFFKAKRLGRQLWVSFNGVVGRFLLSLFQQSYKGFKGKFFKIRCNNNDPTLLEEFPLYWTEEAEFQKPKRLEDLPQREQEVCLLLSNLKVVFDTATLIKHEYCPTGLKAYIGIPFPFTPASDILHVRVTEISLVFNVHSMLRLSKKDLVARAKKMKAYSQASPAKELKIEAVVEVAISDDEGTCSGPVFKRRQKAAPAPTEHSTSDG